MPAGPVVVQSEGRGAVVVHGGLFSELRSEEEITNALWAYNADLLGPDGQPMRDPCAPYQYAGQEFAVRPRPVWYSKAVLDDLIAQSRRAVEGGA